MAQGARLSGTVVYVRDLNRSVSFYRELLGLDVVDSSTTAALLLSGKGESHLVLRATGPGGTRPLGAVGVQYMTWTMASRADLDQAEKFLQKHSAHRETRTDGGTTSVEGHDPDDLAVVLIYSDDPNAVIRELPSRIYAW
jgi:catechol 2,3-dioxygenase-like lactoylglutathione lyase family enzyme